MWTTNTTTLYNLGHTLGQQDLNTAGAQDHFVILDFGAPRAPSSGGHITYSTILFDTSVYASVDQIAAAVEQFARGYYFGTGSDTNSTLFVAIGTSNNHDANGNYVTPDHGQAWARMVNTVESWIQSNGYSSQVQAVGASDMELGYNDKTTTIG